MWAVGHLGGEHMLKYNRYDGRAGPRAELAGHSATSLSPRVFIIAPRARIGVISLGKITSFSKVKLVSHYCVRMVHSYT